MGKLKPINPTKAQIVANPQAAAHDYDNFTHKPQINGHELVGNKTGDDLGLQNKLTAGENITINANGEISATGGTITSAAVNQNGTITFTMSDGSTVTTTGESVIGPQGDKGDKGDKGDTGAAGAQGEQGVKGDPGATGADGFSPTATVAQTQSGATVTITDKNGTTTANISNGAPGQDYVLTAQDKDDIADIVLSELPTTQGVQYGNTSN